MKKVIISITAVVLCAFIFPGNDKEKKKWDVNDPPGSYKTARFTTTEGTFMSVDVSPDGKELVFDLLGDIYSMPVTGGEAKLLRGGHAFELQPRFSPDGQWIVFTSDASGGDNIWLMKKDGSDAKQVTKENFRLLNSPVFTADGQYIIARKHFTSRRSLGAGELWMYHISGGEGVQITKRKNDQQDLGEPCVSRDGKYVYYSEDMYPGGYFQYNKDPNNQIYVIKRFDLKKGESEVITGGPGSAFRPQVSKDGKTLAFLKRVRTKTVLFIRNLETGEEWPVYDGLTKDQIEAWAIFGTYPNFCWLNEKEIMIWSDGKLKKVDITKSNSAVDVPFSAACNHRLYDALKFKQNPAPDQFTVKVIRHAKTSPDGKMLVFSAAGYLYKKDLPNGKPERLTTGIDFEFEPSFSPNGQEIVFVTWNDHETGTISKLSLSDKKITKLSRNKGIFRGPAYSPDGKSIVYWKEDGNDHQGSAYSLDPGIYTLPSAGGVQTLVIKEGHSPSFTPDGKRVWFHSGEGDSYAFKSCDLTGNEKQTHFTSSYSGVFSPSPDGKFVAFIELYKVYVAAIPPSGKTLSLSGGMGSMPVKQVARDAGINLHWSSDSKKLHWTLGQEYFSTELNKKFSFLPGAPDSLPGMDTTGIKVGLVLNSDKPKGMIALKGARIITMIGDEVIENGIILVTDNKITAVGTSSLQIPAGAKIIDVSGKTIMPGFVDVHAHIGNFRHGLSPQQQWSYFANLAYGVTTIHDPSSNTEMIFSQAEMVRSGAMTGPRIFSTGWILYGAEGDYKSIVNSLDDAKSHLRRTAAFGAFSVKSYNQPRRDQRQQVITGARELGIMVVPEGGSTSWYNITHVMDGHTGVEHNLPFAPLYNDVVQLWAASKTQYTPTLIVAYGAINGENYWYQHTNVWEKERLLKFTPRAIIDTRSRHRTMIPEEEYENGHILISKSCKKLADAGVKVNLGAHGQLQGLGVHWELWMLKQGGMTNMQALRCATMNGAEYIGMEQYIGSIEAGKLADLIIMDKNPLDNIQNTETVKYTMINGRLYDCDTMDELGTRERKRGKFYWENPKWVNGFPWHEGGHGDED